MCREYLPKLGRRCGQSDFRQCVWGSKDLSKMTVRPKRLVHGGVVDQDRDWRRTARSRSGGR